MSDIKKYTYRLWCKNCNDFKIHNKSNDKFICECETEYTSIKIKDIPNKKVLEQRKRYEKYRTEKFRKTLNLFSMCTFSSSGSLFDEVGGVENILIEADAGLKHEEQLILEEKQKIIQERKEELKRFKNTRRNENCLCGSNKKYKKCCLLIHQTW